MGSRPRRRPGSEDLGRRPGWARPRVDGADRLRGRPADRSGRGGCRRAWSRRGHRRLAALVAAHLGWPSVDGYPACPRGGRARRGAAPSGRPPGGAPRPVPGRRHRGGGLRRAALRVDSSPAGSSAPRPRNLVAGGPRSHGDRRSLGGEGPREPRGLAPSAATPDRRGGSGRPRSLGRRPSPPAGRRRRPGAGPVGPSAPAGPSASGLVEGDPRAIADRIMAFLEQRGFV